MEQPLCSRLLLYGFALAEVLLYSILNLTLATRLACSRDGPELQNSYFLLDLNVPNDGACLSQGPWTTKTGSDGQIRISDVRSMALQSGPYST